MATASVLATVSEGLPKKGLMRLIAYRSGIHVGEVYVVLIVEHQGKRFHLRSSLFLFFDCISKMIFIPIPFVWS
jgi:hypothetical protein